MQRILAIVISLLMLGQAWSQDVNGTKEKIDALKKQKDGIDAEIKSLEASLPKPIEPNWKFKGNAAINLGQNLLGSNWTSSYGGNSTLNLGGLAHLEANYKKGRHEWNNSFDGLMGFFKNINVDSGVNDDINKNADQLQISSKYLFDLQKANLKLGMGMNFLSQFTKTYKIRNSVSDPDFLLSDFLAPGVLDLSPGLEWKPVPYFSAFFAPASGRMTFVTNDTIITRNTKEANRFGNDVDQRVRMELGARLELVFEKEIVKNLTYRSRAQLFNNWSRPDAQLIAINSTRANIDVNWQNDFFYKLTKNIAVNFGFQIMRDDDVRINEIRGNSASPLFAPWNWRNNIGIGFVAGF